jgi:hypothetical protein
MAVAQSERESRVTQSPSYESGEGGILPIPSRKSLPILDVWKQA